MSLQSTSSSGLGLGSSVAEGQQETFTPTITLTQPVEVRSLKNVSHGISYRVFIFVFILCQSSDEVSTVLVAGLGQSEGPSKRKQSPVAAASAMLDPPGLAQGSGKQGMYIIYIDSASGIVDALCTCKYMYNTAKFPDLF